MSDIDINPTSIIIGYWIEYLIFLSIATILAKKSNSITPKPEINKGIRLIAVILLVLSVFQTISLLLDTFGYLNNKKEYTRYETCEIKQITVRQDIFQTEIHFTCKDGKNFIIDKWTLDFSKEVIFNSKGKKITSSGFTDDEKVLLKFTILPKTKIVIDSQLIR